MKNKVQSIERAFQLLQVIHQRQNGIRVGELSAETKLHTSTVSRIVSTLEHIGAIDHRDSKLYIGDQIINLANHAPWTEQFISIATPHLRDLAAATKEAVGLTLIEGDECHVFFQLPSMHHIQIRDWTGERFPLHATSTGKLYLAELSTVERAQFFAGGLAKVASKTVVDSAEFVHELPKIKNEGVAWTIDELEDGLTSVAAAIYDKQGIFVAGLYISIPSYRVVDKSILAEQARTTATAISLQLGYES